MSVPDFSTSDYGLTASSDGSLSFDVSGAIASKTPKFVSALEDASTKVGAAGAAIVAGLDAAAEVAAYIAPDVAAALSTASAEATAIGASGLTGPLAPFVAALVVVVAFVESNLASGGTGCCGVAPYTYALAVKQLQFEHDPASWMGHGSSFYVPDPAEVRKLMLYSGQQSDAAPCDPSNYKWNALFPGVYLPRQAGSPEAYIEGVLRAHYENSAGCWTDWEGLNKQTPAVLAAAVKAWNNTHYAGTPRTILVSPIDPWSNPINFAVQQLRKASGQSAAFVSLKVNTGAQIPKLAKLPKLIAGGIKLNPIAILSNLTKGSTKPMDITLAPIPYSLVAGLGSNVSNASASDTALVAISAPAPATTTATGIAAVFSKPVFGKVTVGELGIGGVALAIVAKLMKVW